MNSHFTYPYTPVIIGYTTIKNVWKNETCFLPLQKLKKRTWRLKELKGAGKGEEKIIPDNSQRNRRTWETRVWQASIEAILEAKYKESNIERIRTEARWEEEKQQEKLEKKNERKAETTAETVEKITPYIVLVVTIIVALFMIFFVFPAIDGCFAAVETLTEWTKNENPFPETKPERGYNRIISHVDIIAQREG